MSNALAIIQTAIAAHDAVPKRRRSDPSAIVELSLSDAREILAELSARTQGASATLWKRDSTNEWVVDLHLQGDNINKTVRWSGPVKDDVINAISSEHAQGAAVDVEALKREVCAAIQVFPDDQNPFITKTIDYLVAQGHLPAPSSEKGE